MFQNITNFFCFMLNIRNILLTCDCLPYIIRMPQKLIHTRMCICKYSTTWFENKCRDVNSLVFWLHVAYQNFFSEYTGTKKWYVCHNFLVDMHELYSNCKSPLIEGFLNLFNSSDMTIFKPYNLIHIGD